MSDIRLKTKKYEIDGKTYILRCNMNVLADVQEINGGEIMAALSGTRSIRTALQFGAAMLNDYADECGWPEHYTERSLGRLISTRDIGRFTDIITELIHSALAGDDDVQTDEDEGNTEKNAVTSQGK